MNTFLTVFAGRRRYLDISRIYFDLLLERGTVTEVHLWDYARNADDSECIAALCRDRPGYRLMRPANTAGRQWRNYYEHYAVANGMASDDVVIKCDDDVIYFDVERMPGFLRDVRPGCLYFPGIVNNDVCAHLQSLHQVHDFLPRVDPARTVLGFRAPLTSWYQSAECFEAIHSAFLRDPGRFVLPAAASVRWGSRVSINLFAAKVSTVRPYFGMFLRQNGDDEAFFSADVCALTGTPNLIVPSFNVVHYLFEPQAHGSQRSHYLPAYRQLAANCRDECAAARARATHSRVPG